MTAVPGGAPVAAAFSISRMSFEMPDMPKNPLWLLMSFSKSSGPVFSFLMRWMRMPGIEVAAARAHQKALRRRESHGRVDRPPVVDGAERSAVSEVAGDDIERAERPFEELGRA